MPFFDGPRSDSEQFIYENALEEGQIKRKINNNNGEFELVDFYDKKLCKAIKGYLANLGNKKEKAKFEKIIIGCLRDGALPIAALCHVYNKQLTNHALTKPTASSANKESKDQKSEDQKEVSEAKIEEDWQKVAAFLCDKFELTHQDALHHATEELQYYGSLDKEDPKRNFPAYIFEWSDIFFSLLNCKDVEPLAEEAQVITTLLDVRASARRKDYLVFACQFAEYLKKRYSEPQLKAQYQAVLAGCNCKSILNFAVDQSFIYATDLYLLQVSDIILLQVYKVLEIAYSKYDQPITDYTNPPLFSNTVFAKFLFSSKMRALLPAAELKLFISHLLNKEDNPTALWLVNQKVNPWEDPKCFQLCFQDPVKLSKRGLTIRWDIGLAPDAAAYLDFILGLIKRVQPAKMAQEAKESRNSVEAKDHQEYTLSVPTPLLTEIAAMITNDRSNPKRSRGPIALLKTILEKAQKELLSDAAKPRDSIYYNLLQAIASRDANIFFGVYKKQHTGLVEDALHMISLDLVGIVRSYCFWSPPPKEAPIVATGEMIAVNAVKPPAVC